jgi:hypothetical protein
LKFAIVHLDVSVIHTLLDNLAVFWVADFENLGLREESEIELTFAGLLVVAFNLWQQL